MPFKTKKITNLPLNYEKHFSIKRNIDSFEINNTENINEITILINEDNYIPVEEVNSFCKLYLSAIGFNSTPPMYCLINGLNSRY